MIEFPSTAIGAAIKRRHRIPLTSHLTITRSNSATSRISEIRTQPSQPLIGYSDGVETDRRLNTTRTIPPNSAASATIARFHVELPVDGSCVGAPASGGAAGGVGPPEPTIGGSEVVVVLVGEATVVGGKISTIVVVELVVVGAVEVVGTDVVEVVDVVELVVVVVNGAKEYE